MTLSRFLPSGRDGDGEDTEGKLHRDQVGLPVQPAWSPDEHDGDPHQEPGPSETETLTRAETAATGGARGSS